LTMCTERKGGLIYLADTGATPVRIKKLGVNTGRDQDSKVGGAVGASEAAWGRLPA
jgi:hypothetical protein